MKKIFYIHPQCDFIEAEHSNVLCASEEHPGNVETFEEQSVELNWNE